MMKPQVQCALRQLITLFKAGVQVSTVSNGLVMRVLSDFIACHKTSCNKTAINSFHVETSRKPKKNSEANRCFFQQCTHAFKVSRDVEK